MIALALAALFIAGQQAAPAPGPAPSPAPATATQTPPAAAPDAEQICRRQPIEGSRRSERVCHTKAEWDIIRENARSNRDTASRDQRDRGGY
jgi:hypothetical protein